MEQSNQPELPEFQSSIYEEVNSFYKGDFKEIVVTFFRNAIDGIYSIFKTPSMLLFYILLMLINVLQPSLKASGTNDATFWHLSPITILSPTYLTNQISINLF